MIIKCPECSKKISNEFINLKLGLAQCNSCDVSFSVSPKSNNTKREIKDGEHDLNIYQVGSGLTMSLSWKRETSSFEFLFLGFFAIFWNLVSHTVFWTFFNSGKDDSARFFPLIHVLIGLFIIYYFLAKLLNKTIIEINNGTLKVSIKPLPWLGNHELQTSNIEQVYVEKKVSYGKNNTPQVSYQLKVISEGTHIKIANKMNKYENARMIEQSIEARLGISDIDVENEHT